MKTPTETVSQLYALVHQSADDLSSIVTVGKVTLKEAAALVVNLRAANSLAIKLRSQVAREPEPKIGD